MQERRRDWSVQLYLTGYGKQRLSETTDRGTVSNIFTEGTQGVCQQHVCFCFS